MNLLDNVPHVLRPLRNWVCFRKVEKLDPKTGNVKVTKVPYRPREITTLADTTNPDSWGTYDEARAAYEANSGWLDGIGFVFSKGCGFFGIDIDKQPWNISPQKLEERNRYLSGLLNLATYIEISPSGNGFHIICTGEMPKSSEKWNDLGIEWYGWDCYLTFTGNIWEGHDTITNQQQLFNRVHLKPDPKVEELIKTEDVRRKLGLSDADIVAAARRYAPSFSKKFDAIEGNGPGDWHITWDDCLDILDMVCGDPEQIERVVATSPLVLESPPHASGEARPRKHRRLFARRMAEVHARNNERIFGMPGIAHGEKLWQEVERCWYEREMAAAEQMRQAEDAIGKMSKGSASLLDAFPMLTTEHRELTRPPGVVGWFVEATERASRKPFTKYAIPATFAALSGVLARGYKISKGAGLELNFILAAPTATGKTEISKAWGRFFNAAIARMPATIAGEPRAPLITASSSSIQGIMPDFIAKPSSVWFIEECGAQMAILTNPKPSPVDSQFKDAINTMFDASEHGKKFASPRSVQSRKSDLVEINNLSVAKFWTTTPQKLDLKIEDALDGFLSRFIIVRHTTKSVRTRMEVEPLHENLLQRLTDRLNEATRLDNAYEHGPDPGHVIVNVDMSQITILNEQLLEICEKMVDRSLEGRLPPAYVAVSRLPFLSLKMAGVMAVMDNPYNPIVNEQQLKWAFGYSLQNLVEVLSAMDHGEMGENANDEVLTVIRCYKKMIKKPEWKGFPGIPTGVFKNNLRGLKPFKTSGPNALRMVSDVLRQMLNDRQFYTHTIRQPGQKTDTTFWCANIEDHVWKLV